MFIATGFQYDEMFQGDFGPRRHCSKGDLVPRDIVPRRHCSRKDIVPRETLFQGTLFHGDIVPETTLFQGDTLRFPKSREIVKTPS